MGWIGCLVWPFWLAGSADLGGWFGCFVLFDWLSWFG
jgi:hypothetical protein